MPKRKQDPITLPGWAQVSPKRRDHIRRVVELLASWSRAMKLRDDEASRWIAAGILHDSLRDAPEEMLRVLTGDRDRAAVLLHGPAAAVRAEQDGERRQDVLEAVRYHTIGWHGWARTGRALYLADFLEPGRKYLGAQRAALAAKVPRDFDRTFKECVRLRIEWALDKDGVLFPETVALWNAVR